MKSFAITAALTLLSLTSLNSFALENGKFTSIDYTEDLSPFYKSVVVDNTKCKNGGAVITFNQSSSFNLCHGNVEESAYEYKECIGKEVGSFPLPKVCVGVKKTIRSITTKTATFNKSENAIVYTIETHNNEDLVFEEEYRLLDLGNNKLKVQHGFKDHRDGRHGLIEVNYKK